MTPLGFKGAPITLLIRQGADMETIHVTYQDADGNPISLTGCTLRGGLKKAWNSPAMAATFVFTMTDEDAGQFDIDCPHSQTVNLTAGVNENDPASQYVLQVDVEDAAGKIVPMYAGQAYTFRDIGLT